MPAPRRREERTVAQLDFGGWSETAASSSEPASIQPEPVQSAQPKQRTQRGSLTTNQCTAGEWVSPLPEQPQAGAHSLVATVSRLQLAKVLNTYNNGAVGVQVFDEQPAGHGLHRRRAALAAAAHCASG